jgi:serine protease Do
LGKGIISNRSVKDSVITNSKLQHVLQHTAQVDAGSSGGALLISDDDEKSGYSIIGVNTWKARERENANFAIPCNAVLAFLQDMIKNENRNEKQLVETKTKKLINEKKDGNYKNIVPYISENFIFSIPAPAFIEMLADASKDAKDDADKAFRRLEPFEAFRIIIADALYKKLKKSENVFTNTKEEITGYISTVTINGKEVEIGWTNESGNWLLTNCSNILQKTDTGNAYTRLWDDIGCGKYAGYKFSLSKEKEKIILLCYEMRYSRYFATYMDIILGSVNGEVENPDGGEDKIKKGSAYIGASYGFNIQLPLKLCPFYTNPFIKIPLGGNMSADYAEFHVGFAPGVRFAIPVGKKKDVFIFLDAEYYFRHSFLHSEYPFQMPDSKSMFGFSLGYAF